MDNPIVTETAQMYKGLVSICEAPRNPSSAVQLASPGGLRLADELSLLQIVSQQQPVVIYLNADSEDFRLYKGGIFEFPARNCRSSSLQPNHAILVVVRRKGWWPCTLHALITFISHACPKPGQPVPTLTSSTSVHPGNTHAGLQHN